jgi:DNA-dependent RNA polymerase auxiliary subunit epsilon
LFDVDMMQKNVFFVFVALAIFIAPSGVMPPSAPRSQSRVLILSSTETLYPMQYASQVATELKQAGYNVTFLSGSAITLDVLTNQLDQYDLLIWRTDSYERGNTTYWYLGQQPNVTTYAGAVGIKAVDVSNGMIAVSAAFISKSFGPGSLTHLKLAIMISSMSITVAELFVAAGVKTTIDLYKTLLAPPSLFDWVIEALVGYLTSGNSVRDSIYKVIYNYEYVSSLDDSYLPPLSFLGNGNLLIV